MDGMSTVMNSSKPTKFSYEELLDPCLEPYQRPKQDLGLCLHGEIQRVVQFVAIKRMKGNMSTKLKILSQSPSGNVVSISLYILPFVIGFSHVL